MPAPAKNQLLRTTRNSIVTIIETGAQAWSPLQVAAGKAGEVATKAVSDGADKFVGLLKDLISKIVSLVKEKMGDEKENKEETKEETKKKAIGDVSAQWKFEKTEPGKKFHDGLLSETSDVAVKNVVKEINADIQNHVRKPIEKARETLAEVFKILNNKFVKDSIEPPVRKAAEFIVEITSLEGFLAAAEKLGSTVAELEKKYVAAAGKKEELEKLVNEASHSMWLSLAAECIAIWQKIFGLKAKVRATFKDEPEYVTEPLVDLFQTFFMIQIRGLNAIRILYTKAIRTSLPDAKDADGVKNASRTALRDAIFTTVNTMANMHWTNYFDALNGVLQAYILDKFAADVWPTLSKPLQELQKAIPEQLASLGLDVVSLGLTIASTLLTQIVNWVANKIGMSLEEFLFGQGESSYGSGEGVSE